MEKTKVGAFIPMPVAPTVLVGANVDGKPTYLTVGFASGANMRPPILCVSLNRRHYTVKGILENGTFSVNIPSAAHVRECDYCGLVSGRSVDKSKVFTSFYGELKTAPMIEEFPIVCECRFTGQKIDFSMDSVFFGEVVQAYVDKALYKKGASADILRIDPLLTGLDRQYRGVGQAVGKTFSIGWEYLSGTSRAGTGGGTCRIVTRSPRHVLAIGLDPKEAQGQAAIGMAMEEIAGYARERGLSPTTGPFIRREEGFEPEAGLRAGYVFPSSLPGRGRVESGKIPGGRFAECLHVGPYEMTDSAVESLRAFIRENGFKASGALYAFYHNDPATTPVEKLETLLSMPIKRA